MRVSTIARLAGLLLVASAGPVSAQQPGERPSYERVVPPSLASLARIGEDSARAIAAVVQEKLRSQRPPKPNPRIGRAAS